VTTEMQEPLLIDVNAASADDLIAIDGIGPALAQRIVQHRQEHGPFGTLDELTQIRGIGPSSLERIRSQLSPAPHPPEPPVTGSPAPHASGIEPEAGRLVSLSVPEESQAETMAEIPDIEEVAMAEDQVARESMQADEIPAQEAEAADIAEQVPPVEENEPTPETEAEIKAEQPAAEPELANELPEPEIEMEQEAPELGADLPGEEPEVALDETLAEEKVSADVTGDAETEEEPEEEMPAATTDADGGLGFWRGFLLVAAGALVGALVMLLVLLAYSGTLSYASRNEVEALSRNMDTIYQNSEIAWARLDRLAAENADLVAKVDRLMLLSGRVSDLEQGVSDLRADMDSIEGTIASVEADLASLRETYDARLTEVDATLAAQGDLLDRMESDLGTVRESIQSMEERLGRYDSFFGALRDLLIDLQGPGTEAAVEQSAAE